MASALVQLRSVFLIRERERRPQVSDQRGRERGVNSLRELRHVAGGGGEVDSWTLGERPQARRIRARSVSESNQHLTAQQIHRLRLTFTGSRCLHALSSTPNQLNEKKEKRFFGHGNVRNSAPMGAAAFPLCFNAGLTQTGSFSNEHVISTWSLSRVALTPTPPQGQRPQGHCSSWTTQGQF